MAFRGIKRKYQHLKSRCSIPTLKVLTKVEDRKFIEMMENGTNKNAQGNWEMPLPFCLQNVFMSNNRSYTVKRLNNLLRTLQCKLQM